MLELIVLLVSITVIAFTAQLAIDRSIKIAKTFNLSDAFIGLTVLSIGTSLPEISTAIVGGLEIASNQALYKDISSIIVGANVGSDIVQQTMILGLVGLASTLKWERERVKKDISFLILGVLFVMALAFNGEITQFAGAIMVISYIAFLYYLWRSENGKKIMNNGIKEEEKSRNIFGDSLFLIAALLVMAFAADKALFSVKYYVDLLGISATLLGALTLGIASALPELMTAISCIINKRADMAEGTLIGSNITNPVFGLGCGALFHGFYVPANILLFDFPFKIFISLALFMMIRKNGEVSRQKAFALISLYFLYIIIKSTFFAVDS